MNIKLGILSLIFVVLAGVVIGGVIFFTMGGNWAVNTALSVGSELPIIGETVGDIKKDFAREETKTELEQKKAHYQDKISDFEDMIADQQETIEELQSKVSELESELEATEKAKSEKQNILVELEQELKDEEDREARFSSVVETYANMDPSAVDNIISGFPDWLAVEVLLEMPEDVRGDVLEEMDDERASRLSEQMIGQW